MSIIQALKQLIGYSGSDLDQIFAIVSMFICIFFLFTFFNILNSLFKKRY